MRGASAKQELEVNLEVTLKSHLLDDNTAAALKKGRHRGQEYVLALDKEGYPHTWHGLEIDQSSE